MTDDQPHLVPRAEPFDLSVYDVPHERPFLIDLYVQRNDLSGTIEHVSNVQYVRWLDRAAELHADSLGYTRAAMLQHQIMWFVARHEVDYLAEVWRNDQLVVATWVRDVRRVKSWRDYVIVRPRDGVVVCRASTLWVLVNLSSRRPTRISSEMVLRFDPLHATARSESVT